MIILLLESCVSNTPEKASEVLETTKTKGSKVSMKTTPISTIQGQNLGSLESSIYDSFKRDFLNIDPQLYEEIVFDDYRNDSTQDFFSASAVGDNIAGVNFDEGGFNRFYYGGSYWSTNNTHSTQSVSRYLTGGTPVKKGASCGLSVNNNYLFALANSGNICKKDQWGPGGNTRMWLGTGPNSRDKFLSQRFSKLSNTPLNRICIEFEVDSNRWEFFPGDNKADAGNPEMAQIVNHSTIDSRLKWLRFEMGTYTSLYGSDTKGWKMDPETGGTFHSHESHFYHKPSQYKRYPLDRAYAINSNTIIACFSDAPAGGRSQMRPPFSANPLMTVMSENAAGETNAFSYMNYITRAYFDVNNPYSQMKYPQTIKYNKVFMLYEKNDIQALSKNGAVLSVDMAEKGKAANHSFTIYNNASNDRTYRVIVMAGGNLAQTKGTDKLRIYIDDNADGIHNNNEMTELIPNGKLILKAKTDLALVAVQKPAWGVKDHTAFMYNREFAPATFTIQEIGRLRMTSFVMRTWAGSVSEISNKKNLLAQMIHPDPKNSLPKVHVTLAQWNQDKPNNNRLIRNSPDYKMAIAKLRGRNTASNMAPIANAGVDQSVTDNNGDGSESISLNASLSSDSDGSISSYVWEKGSTQIATGKNANVTLSIGNHSIRLTVTDDSGDSGFDTVAIKINRPSPTISLNDCESLAHGSSESQTRFESSSVPFDSNCKTQVQTRSCNDGVLSSYSPNNYTKNSCSVTPAPVVYPAPTSITLVNPSSSPSTNRTPELLVSGVQGVAIVFFRKRNCMKYMGYQKASNKQARVSVNALALGLHEFSAKTKFADGTFSACSSASFTYEVVN